MYNLEPEESLQEYEEIEGVLAEQTEHGDLRDFLNIVDELKNVEIDMNLLASFVAIYQDEDAFKEHERNFRIAFRTRMQNHEHYKNYLENPLASRRNIEIDNEALLSKFKYEPQK